MKPGAHDAGNVSPIVYHERRARLAAQIRYALDGRDRFAREKTLVAELKNLRAGFQNLACGGQRFDAESSGCFGIENRIEPGQGESGHRLCERASTEALES